MATINTLSVDNKEVKVALLNGKVVFSGLEDWSLSNATEANAEVSAAGITIGGGGGYSLPDDCFPITGEDFGGEPLGPINSNSEIEFEDDGDFIHISQGYNHIASFNSESKAFVAPEGNWVTIYFNGSEARYGSWPVLQESGGVTLSGTYVPPGDTNPYTYYCYNTDPVAFVEAGSGSTHPFPVSQHVFARARHYGSAPASFTWNGETFTVNDTVDLSAYAQAQGIKVNASAIEDIQLLFTDKAVALSAVPCLMSKMQFQGLFHKDTLSGTVAWTVPQLTASDFACKPQPVVFTSNTSNGELKWSTPQLLSAVIPVEDTSLIEYPTYLGTTGDSGRPVAVKIGGEYAIVSHNHAVEKPAFGPIAPYYMKGPDYTTAYPALKAYVESKGDTLKTLSAWTNN